MTFKQHDENFYTESNVSVSLPVNVTHLRYKKLHPDAKFPVKAHDTDLGYDLFALEDTVLYPGVVTKVRTGIALGFPKGFGGIIKDRSSIATKLEVFTVAGVIDSDYTGEIIIAFFNPGRVKIKSSDYSGYDGHFPDEPVEPQIEYDEPLLINKGDKIAQLVLIPTITFPMQEVDSLEETQRGSNGFGSTGA